MHAIFNIFINVKTQKAMNHLCALQYFQLFNYWNLMKFFFTIIGSNGKKSDIAQVSF